MPNSRYLETLIKAYITQQATMIVFVHPYNRCRVGLHLM